MDTFLLAIALMCLDSSYMTQATGSPGNQRECVAEILKCYSESKETGFKRDASCIKPKPYDPTKPKKESK